MPYINEAIICLENVRGVNKDKCACDLIDYMRNRASEAKKTWTLRPNLVSGIRWVSELAYGWQVSLTHIRASSGPLTLADFIGLDTCESAQAMISTID